MNGTFITTDFQTAGRGQAGNTWWASLGQNYMGSLIYYPQQIKAENIFTLTQAISLAVVEVLKILDENLAPSTRIKWPNDIYVGQQKIAGLLIQNSLLGNLVQWSVMGLGLNVNELSFPPELTKSATSLAILNDGEKFNLPSVSATIFATLLAKLNHYLEPLQRVALRKDYHQKLYRLEEWADYLNVGAKQTFRGKIRGVDPQGLLLVEHTVGRVKAYDLKEIRYL